MSRHRANLLGARAGVRYVRTEPVEEPVSEQAAPWSVLRRAGCLLIAAAAGFSLWPPGVAGAHVRSGIVATDYRATVDPLPARLRTTFSARVYDADRALGLTIATGHTVVVLSRAGDPLLTIGARRPRAVWHDARLRSLPAGLDTARWRVPLLVDGERVQLEGALVRIRPPAAWWWLVVAAGFALASAAILLVRRPARVAAAVAFGVLAGAATVALALMFGLASTASMGRRIEALDELAFAAVGLAMLRAGPPLKRAAAAGALGLLAVFAATLRGPALSHGVVLSAAPANAARAAVVLGLCAGAAAIVAGALAALATGPGGQTQRVSGTGQEHRNREHDSRVRVPGAGSRRASQGEM
jgi:hypothetical protein